MTSLDITQLALPKGKVIKTKPKRKLPRHHGNEHFIKGPIPLDWITIAAQLPGKSLQIGITLHYLAGLKKTSTVRLTQTTLNKFGVSRHCKYRALRCLEQARLITLNRTHGKNPTVTILPVSKDE
jgi:hypothetical protein